MSAKVKALLLILHVAVFIYGFQLQRLDSELSNINQIGWSIYFSRGAALCLAMDMCLILIPACRRLLSLLARLLHTLFGIGQGSFSDGAYSTSVLYHKYIALYIAIFTAIHLGGHCINFYRLQVLGKGSKWSYHFGTWAGLTGYGMLLLLTLMFVTAHRRIRRPKYEVFWYTHHVFVVVMVLLGFHAYGCFVKTNDGVCRGYGSWRYILLATSLYGLDRLLRFMESRRQIQLISATAHPGGAIELCFRPPPHLLHYHPGQHLYLNIPVLSKYQWHPFTITSSPIESTITLDIRQDGDWTRSLGEYLGYGDRSSTVQARLDRAVVMDDPSQLPKIRVDGPYGGPRRDVLDFDHAVLIGTGNGITTFSGILRHIWFRHQMTQSSRLQCLDLYWVSRDTKKLDWFKSLFSMERTVELFRMGLIRIHIYFTASSALGQAPKLAQHPSSMVKGRHHHHQRKNRSLTTGGHNDDEEEEDDDDEEREAKHTRYGGSKRARAAFLEQLVRSTKPLSKQQQQHQEDETTALTIQIDEHGHGRRHSYSSDDDEHEEHHELLSPRSLFPDEQLLSGGATSTISLSTLRSPLQISTQSSTATAADSSSARARVAEVEVDDNTSRGYTIIGHDNMHFGRPRFDQILHELKATLIQQRKQQQRRRRGQDYEDDDDEDEDEEGKCNHLHRSSWSLLPSIRRKHHAEPIKVGVFYCGSPALSKMLGRECKRISDQQTRFVLVTE